MSTAKSFSRLILGVLAVLSFNPLEANGQRLEKMRIAYPTLSASQAPFWIAKDTGIFEKEGLDADISYVKGAQRLFKECWPAISKSVMSEDHRLFQLLPKELRSRLSRCQKIDSDMFWFPDYQ